MARPGRKLLVASIGVAAVSYACHKTENGGGARDGDGVEQVGNLMPPEPIDAAPPPATADPMPEPVGNLMPPQDPGDAAPPQPTATPEPHPVGNLMPPPEPPPPPPKSK